MRYAQKLSQERLRQGRRLESWAMTYLINEREKKYGFICIKGKDLTAKTARVIHPRIFSKRV